MMDYEKKYERSLDRAEKIIKYYKEHNRNHEASIEDLESVFPELKESEDERIRKALVRFHKSTIDVDGIKGEDIIAWLEKQKSVGEIVERCKNSWYNEGKIAGMAEGLTDDEKYQQGWHDALEKQGEHDETSTAIKNPEAYRIGFADGEAHAKEEMNTWSDDDEENLQNCCGAIWAVDYYTYDDKQEMEEWLKSLKDRLS